MADHAYEIDQGINPSDILSKPFSKTKQTNNTMSEKYDIKGTIHLIGDVQQVSEKFKKRTVVITTPDEKYPQSIPIDFVQDKCVLLDDFSVGDEATISFNLRGSEYKDKFYVNLTGWKIEAGEAF